MQRIIVVFFLSLSLLVTSDVYARRGGGSFSSPSRSVPSRSAPRTAPRKTAPTKPSTITKKSVTNQKPKAVSKNKLDQKQQKMLASKDKEAFKKYSNKSQATDAYKESLAKNSTYTNSTAPTQRPSHIPEKITQNGQPVNVTYNVLPGGGYGYGYMDPVTMAFIALTPRYYVVDPYAMRSAGYGQWDASGRPVITRVGPSSPLLPPPPPGWIVFWIVIIIIAGVVVVIIIIRL